MVPCWIKATTLAAFIHIVITWITAIRATIAARQVQQTFPLADSDDNCPSVSVIVPAWRERGTIEACIQALKLVDYPCWEIIIVAGGSDGTYQAACQSCSTVLNCQVIEQLPHGKNAALNRGLTQASGKLIAILDADTLVQPDWLRVLVAPLKEPNIVTTSNFAPIRPTPIALSDYVSRFVSHNIYGHVAIRGCSFAMSRELIGYIGGFPEDVLVGVDWDLNVRLLAYGVKPVACSDAEVKSEWPATPGEYWRSEVRWRRAHLTSLFRHTTYFFHSPIILLRHFLPYLIALFNALLHIGCGVTMITGSNHARRNAFAVWAIFVTWISIRYAVLAVQIAMYTRNTRWLVVAWALPFVRFLRMGASMWALFTLPWRRPTMDFKGPRPQATRK